MTGFESSFAPPLVFESAPWSRKRIGPPRGRVIHWTGGPGPAEKTVRVLQQRGLSINTVCDADGQRLLCASDERVTRHAGPLANPWCPGDEYACPGYDNAIAEAERKRGVVREVYRDTINGRTVEHVGFTAAQVREMCSHLDAFVDRWNIPRRVPMAPDGRLIRRTLTAKELRDFLEVGGVLGHFHISSEKRDPGTRPLEQLMQHWGLL
jgi:hypothetical protein